VENNSIKVNDDELDRMIRDTLHKMADNLIISEKAKERIDIELDNRCGNNCN